MRSIDRADTRLLTLVGAGGIGKSRLAIEAAQRYQTVTDNQTRFVSFLGVGTFEAGLQRITQAFGLPLIDPIASEAQLLSTLSETKTALMMDPLP